MVQIIPTILTNNAEEYGSKLRILEKLSDRIQIDFMDGDFVDTESILPEVCDKYISENASLDAHLMVEQPDKWIARLSVSFKYCFVHFEAKNFKDSWPKWFNMAQEKGIKLGIALNPETSVSVIKNIDPMPETVLILGVHPGRSGQTMLEGTLEKIKLLNSFYNGSIGIDGGISQENISQFVQLVNLIYTGNSISGSANPKLAFEKLNEKINKI